MKTTRKLLVFLAIAASTLCFQSCMVTTKTTTTYPDGRVEVVETSAPAPGSIETAGALAGTAAEIAAGHQVHREK